ncbi:hypothetical protein VB716_01380 [Synechococcus sp. CCY9201]|uniref:hypothetical protein n=1 Tax=unclassified Synechococcus TaxID=2626047 RepID=UPI0018CF7E15|nr:MULTISPECIES: hypothetical protein [unclassified Synechococcus]MEA5421997.1 hypothetical protein [Synechococcus sp. CCY9202]MEA5472873.1 hypothetical protein [Synechococcus sp. CCY9201]QPN61348.1 hypothetical protein H8F24_09060 [Synechococcus sp. CBW1002]QPN68019.1 hypothetical protein H8F26_07995 [Synechococcus sp. CBW1006]CAK6690141.1 hypothetical protein IFHNHDMJ_00754 [Synechococcus sp. CBW1107]
MGLAVLLMGIGQAAPAGAVDGNQVKALCMAGFNAAMAAAGKTPPAGMGEFTCTCFLEQVEAGSNIDQARTTCRDKAATRYPVK